MAPLAAVFEHAGAGLRQRVAALGERVPDPLERLEMLVAGIATQPEGRQMLRLLELTMGVAHEPEISRALLTSFGAVRQSILAIIEEGQRAGAIHDDLSAGDAAWLWQGPVVAGGLRLSVSDDEVRDSVVSATATLAELVATPR